MIVLYTQYDILGVGETEANAIKDAEKRFDFSTGNCHKFFANISEKNFIKLIKCLENDISFDFKIRYNKKSESVLIKTV